MIRGDCERDSKHSRGYSSGEGEKTRKIQVLEEFHYIFVNKH